MNKGKELQELARCEQHLQGELGREQARGLPASAPSPTRAARRSVPVSPTPTWRLPTGSPPRSPFGATTAPPPWSRSTSRKPVRVGLVQTPRAATRLPGTTCAATTKKAADDGSPGTSNDSGASAPSHPAGSR